MTKVKILIKEENDAITLTCEPYISRGSVKEQKMGAAITVKVNEMLEQLSKEMAKQEKKEG